MGLPHNSATPAFIQMMQWISNPFALMERSVKQYGDLFALPVGAKFRPVVFVSHPQAIQEILTGDTKAFDVPGESNRIFQPLLGDQSLILLSGNAHRRQRQLLLPPFHGERMRTYGQDICAITQQVISAWQPGKPFRVRSSMQSISLKVILKTVFGVNDGPRYRQLEKLLNDMMEGMSAPLTASLLFFPILQRDLGPFSPWGAFLQRRQQVDELIYAELQSRREHPDPNRTDILSLLMAARDEQGQPMTDAELRDELMTLLIAGHETTATAMTWALYWIHKLPEVKEKLLQELSSVGENPDPLTLSRLPYLKAVCDETLRIYPVGMLTFPRVPQSSYTLMGHDLPPGIGVVGCIYLLHQREDLYPEPKQFKPERFLQRQFGPYEFIPFGGGSRRCIGMAFAQFEMQLALAIILSQVDLALASDRPVYPVRRGLTSGPSRVELVMREPRSLAKPLPHPIPQQQPLTQLS